MLVSPFPTLKVRDCVWPPAYEDKDGVCTAELARRKER